jgi:hypothetical protein
LLDDRAGLKQVYDELRRLHNECIANKNKWYKNNTATEKVAVFLFSLKIKIYIFSDFFNGKHLTFL